MPKRSYQEKDPFKLITSCLENTFTSGLSKAQNKQNEQDSYISFHSTICREGKHGWHTYPRLSMSGSSLQDRLQHEGTFRVRY